jgi:hypothetical protein
MSDNEFRLQREVQELKAEVRRLRRTVEGGFVVIGLAVVVICPQLLMFALIIPAAILLTLLVSPARRYVVMYLSHKQDEHEHDA